MEPDTQVTSRYTARLVVHEEPAIVERLQEQAAQHGHSVAAEVRGAIRLQLAEIGAIEKDREGSE